MARAETALLKKLVKDELLKPRHRADDPTLVAEMVMLEQGIASRLSNLLYQHRRAADEAPRTIADLAHAHAPSNSQLPTRGVASELRPAAPELLDVVIELQARWQQRVEGTLRMLCSELGMPLMTTSAAATNGKTGSKGSRALQMRGVYESEEMLEVIATLDHGNASSALSGIYGFGLVPFELRTPSLAELVDKFGDLATATRQTGIDDELRGWFSEERYHMARRVLRDGHTPLLLLYLRCGAPTGLRGELWARALGVEFDQRGLLHYLALAAEVQRVAQATDSVVKRDVFSPWNEEEYFLFREMVESIVGCFLRDPEVPRNAAAQGVQVTATSTKTGRKYAFPPSGVLPMRGLASYIFPMCFCYDKPAELYLAFRGLWCRHWCRLHDLSARPGTLLPLLRLFEALLQELNPQLCLHLTKLNLHPTRLVLRWIQFAFASYLPVSQLLLLWDRVVGFNTLEVLPLLAVAILLFRSRAILRAQSADEVLLVFSDGSQLRVVPLLQAVLYSPSSLVQSETSSADGKPKRENSKRSL